MTRTTLAAALALALTLGGCASQGQQPQSRQQRVDTFCASESTERGTAQCRQYYAKETELNPPEPEAAGKSYNPALGAVLMQMQQNNQPHYQAWPMPQATARPVNTTCYGSGGMFQCTSQ